MTFLIMKRLCWRFPPSGWVWGVFVVALLLGPSESEAAEIFGRVWLIQADGNSRKESLVGSGCRVAIQYDAVRDTVLTGRDSSYMITSLSKRVKQVKLRIIFRDLSSADLSVRLSPNGRTRCNIEIEKRKDRYEVRRR